MSGQPLPVFGSAAAGRIAVLGEHSRVQGYALAGALVIPADDPVAVRSAWQRLDADVAVVILTQCAARALGAVLDNLGWPLAVVMPE